jgi:hypothetical protein
MKNSTQHTLATALVAVPGDFDPVTKLLSFTIGDKDSLLDNDTVDEIQGLVVEKIVLPHELRIYQNQIHGFALWSDWCSEKDVKVIDESKNRVSR